MRLSWNEIRARAARFADQWTNANYERGASQTFYNEFFEVFGVTRRRVASFGEPNGTLLKNIPGVGVFHAVRCRQHRAPASQQAENEPNGCIWLVPTE